MRLLCEFHPKCIAQAMVRPRTGDFVYSAPELEVMIEDIQTFKALGVTGVVFGVLTCGGGIDVKQTEKCVCYANHPPLCSQWRDFQACTGSSAYGRCPPIHLV
jgi:copper homeostasis protein